LKRAAPASRYNDGAMLGRIVLAAIAPLFLLGVSDSELLASLHDTAAQYYASVGKVAKLTGRETTMDYYQRLIDDIDSLTEKPPQGYDQAAWAISTRGMAQLDISLAEQLISGTPAPMGSIRGLGETLVRSTQDGTMQPVAVYVPSTYVPGKGSPLIVFLHGHPQSESSLLAPHYVQELAEANGTIVIAPYGRGYYDFRGSTSDVYDALDAATAAFSVDSRKIFLAGYSMGGFSVFEVAPVRPNVWSAVMCISGAMLGTDAPKVVGFLKNTPFYVLTGSADDSIPTQYPTVTAAYLSRQGLPVSFYSLPGGIHRLITLMPILSVAWADMVHQIVRSAPPTLGGAVLPGAPPATAMKT
jgi:predicted esterase